MKFFAWWTRGVKKYLLDVRVLYLLAGILISVVAHEFVHVLMHLGSLHSVHFFPDSSTIVAMNVGFLDSGALQKEEIIAYSVTALVQLIAVIDVLAIHDSRSTKSAEQLLFGNSDTLTERENAILLQLVS